MHYFVEIRPQNLNVDLIVMEHALDLISPPFFYHPIQLHSPDIHKVNLGGCQTTHSNPSLVNHIMIFFMSRTDSDTYAFCLCRLEHFWIVYLFCSFLVETPSY